MANRRSNQVVPKKATPKTTKMDERKPKKANKTGSGEMVHKGGKYP